MADTFIKQAKDKVTWDDKIVSWKVAKPSLKQAEAVCKIAKMRGDNFTFAEVFKTWTAGQCSDYIGNKGSGGYYQVMKGKNGN